MEVYRQAIHLLASSLMSIWKRNCPPFLDPADLPFLMRPHRHYRLSHWIFRLVFRLSKLFFKSQYSTRISIFNTSGDLPVWHGLLCSLQLIFNICILAYLHTQSRLILYSHALFSHTAVEQNSVPVHPLFILLEQKFWIRPAYLCGFSQKLMAGNYPKRLLVSDGGMTMSESGNHYPFG